jgi:hypothetical protein
VSAARPKKPGHASANGAGRIPAAQRISRTQRAARASVARAASRFAVSRPTGARPPLRSVLGSIRRRPLTPARPGAVAPGCGRGQPALAAPQNHKELNSPGALARAPWAYAAPVRANPRFARSGEILSHSGKGCSAALRMAAATSPLTRRATWETYERANQKQSLSQRPLCLVRQASRKLSHPGGQRFAALPGLRSALPSWLGSLRVSRRAPALAARRSRAAQPKTQGHTSHSLDTKVPKPLVSIWTPCAGADFPPTQRKCPNFSRTPRIARIHAAIMKKA